jgi:hypothetical protein
LDFGAGEERREVGVRLLLTFGGGEVSNVVAGRLEASFGPAGEASTIVVTGESHHIADSIQEVIHAFFL